MILTTREEGGTGRLLLLLHGAARTLEDWQLVVPLLVDRYRVVSADLRGHGLSPAGEWTWSAVVGDVEDTLDSLGARDAVVAGHSLGGMVATLCGGSSDRVVRVVNLDGLGAGLPAPELVELALAQLPGCATPLPQAEFEALLQQVPVPAVVAGLRRGSDVVDGLVSTRPDESTVRAVLAAVGELDLGAALAAVRVPTLVVRCTRQHPLPPGVPPRISELRAEQERRAEAMLSGVGNPLVEVLDVDATHGLLLEDPVLTAAVL